MRTCSVSYIHDRRMSNLGVCRPSWVAWSLVPRRPTAACHPVTPRRPVGTHLPRSLCTNDSTVRALRLDERLFSLLLAPLHGHEHESTKCDGDRVPLCRRLPCTRELVYVRQQIQRSSNEWHMPPAYSRGVQEGLGREQQKHVAEKEGVMGSAVRDATIMLYYRGMRHRLRHTGWIDHTSSTCLNHASDAIGCMLLSNSRSPWLLPGRPMHELSKHKLTFQRFLSLAVPRASRTTRAAVAVSTRARSRARRSRSRCRVLAVLCRSRRGQPASSLRRVEADHGPAADTKTGDSTSCTSRVESADCLTGHATGQSSLSETTNGTGSTKTNTTSTSDTTVETDKSTTGPTHGCARPGGWEGRHASQARDTQCDRGIGVSIGVSIDLDGGDQRRGRTLS